MILECGHAILNLKVYIHHQEFIQIIKVKCMTLVPHPKLILGYIGSLACDGISL